MTTRHRGFRRAAALAAAAIMAAAGLTGCTLIQYLSATEAQPLPQVDPIDSELSAELRRYYEQQLDWQPCDAGTECATVTAPLNWDDPAAGEIELALTRLPARGESIGSLFTNPGGPGASGVDLVQLSGAYIFGSALREHYDIIGWDPRGVGRSSAVDCLSDDELDEWIFGDPPADAAEQSDEEIIAQATAEADWFGQQCLANTGPLLEFVDTVSTVRDLDLLRAVAGDGLLSYLGFSYGSDIGTQYIERFPERVGRITLDGATDPTLGTLDIALAQQQAFGEATRAYLDDCLTGAECPFTGSTDQAIAEIRATLEQADRDLPRSADGRALTSEVIGTAVSAALYDEASWPVLSDAFAAYSANGDPSGFFALADSYYGRNPDGSYQDNLVEAFSAIGCLDSPAETDPAAIIAFNRAVVAANPLVIEGPEELGDVLCQRWPFASRATLEPVRGEGAAPVLIVGTTGDPATPYQWGQALASQLESATLLTYEGEGHLAYPGGTICVTAAVEGYLLRGEVPAEGTRC